jgi:hypothetical protein
VRDLFLQKAKRQHDEQTYFVPPFHLQVPKKHERQENAKYVHYSCKSWLRVSYGDAKRMGSGSLTALYLGYNGHVGLPEAMCMDIFVPQTLQWYTFKGKGQAGGQRNRREQPNESIYPPAIGFPIGRYES